MKKIISVIKNVSKKISDDNIPAYAAQASFFLFISIFPILIILMSLIKYTPITQEMLLSFVYDYAPDAIGVTLNSWIREIYNTSAGTLSISIILAVWAASRGFISLSTAISNVYKITSKRNYVVNRFFAIIYTIVFIVVLHIAALLIVFGDKLMSYIAQLNKTAEQVVELIGDLRLAVVVVMFFVFFLFLYKFIPFSKSTFRESLPGAIFTSSGWLLFSVFFSIYVNNINMKISIYGSLHTIILLMLWLYFCMYILLLGAELNVYLAEYSAEDDYSEDFAEGFAENDSTESEATETTHPLK